MRLMLEAAIFDNQVPIRKYVHPYKAESLTDTISLVEGTKPYKLVVQI